MYLSLNCTVFDVSKGREFYGPGGPYAAFAGRECGAALAKMSFDEKYLDDVKACEDLNVGEKDKLNNWIQKFQYMQRYPVLGRLIPDSEMPDPNRIISEEEQGRNNGNGEIPTGYAAAPIYLGLKGKVYDVSFGGVTFYGKDCAYEAFAGKNATRALAKMSFDETYSSDISDFSEQDMKVLNDWVKTFEVKKGYPIVGRLE